MSELQTEPTSSPRPALPPANAGLAPTETAIPADRRSSPEGSESPLTRAIALGRRIHATLAREGQLDLHARGRKRYSCRKLARLHSVPASTLWRALAIYQLCERHPELADCQHVGVGHLSVLLGLPREHQLHFLRRAERGRWSRAQLERQIRRAAPRQEGGGTPTEPAAASTAN